MPLYTITLAFIFIAGFTAVLVVPGLPNGDLSLLTIVRKSFPPWFLGVIGGAGALTAMVPAAIFILTAAKLFAKNLYRPLYAPAMTDDQVARLAEVTVVVLGVISLSLAIYRSATLVSLLLTGYAGVSQFFPGRLPESRPSSSSCSVIATPGSDGAPALWPFLNFLVTALTSLLTPAAVMAVG